MLLKDFLVFQQYGLKVNQLNWFEKYHRYHALYDQLLKTLKQIDYSRIGFIAPEADDIDVWAVMDSLIQRKKEVYFSHCADHKKVSFSHIESVYQPFTYYGGQRVYPPTNAKNLTLEILIVPLQLVYQQTGYIRNQTLYKYLKKFNGIKIGIGYEFAHLDQPLTIKETIIFDWLVLV